MIANLQARIDDWIAHYSEARYLRKRAALARLYEMRNATLELLEALTPDGEGRYPSRATNAQASVRASGVYAVALRNAAYAEYVAEVIRRLTTLNTVSSARLLAQADALWIHRKLRHHLGVVELEIARRGKQLAGDTNASS